MPEQTPKLGIKKPLGNETVSRAAFNENYDIIDQNAAAQADLDAHLAENPQDDDVHGIKTTFEQQQFINLLKNGDFASWSQGDDSVPDGWTNLNTPSVSKISGGSFGNITRIVSNTNSYESLYQPISNYNDFNGYTLTLIARVRALATNVNNESRISIQVSDSEFSAESVVADGNWRILTVKKTIVSPNYIRINFAPVWGTIQSGETIEVDWAMLVVGELPVAFANNPLDQALKAVDWQDNNNGSITNYELGIMKIQSGQITDIPGSNTTEGIMNITFPKTFTSLKNVGAIVVSSSLGATSSFNIGIFNKSTTGMSIAYRKTDESTFGDGSSGITIDWFAMGVE